MTTTEYITKPGDRWDTIAYKAYGTVDQVMLENGAKVNAMSLVMGANPEIAADSVLVEGLLLQIPVIPDSAIQSDKDVLPPWKKV